jgi:hypothetical protein
MMKPGQRLPLKSPCHCHSGKKYGKCCFQRDRKDSKLKRYVYLFLMTHGTGDAGRTTDPRVLESWAEIERQIDRLNIKFDKAYTDSDYLREDFPLDGVTIPKSVNIDLHDFDPQYSVLFSLAKRNPQLRWVPCESQRLMEDYRSIATRLLESEATGNVREEDTNDFFDIIHKRDLFIAERIKENLKIGEVGVLFLGSHHNSDTPSLTDRLNEAGIEVCARMTSPPK